MISIVWNKAEKFALTSFSVVEEGWNHTFYFFSRKKETEACDCAGTVVTRTPMHPCTHTYGHKGTVTMWSHKHGCERNHGRIHTLVRFCRLFICAIFYCTFYKMVTGRSFRYINGCSFARCSERTAAKGAGQERPINRLDYLTSSVPKVTNRSILWFVEKASETLLTLTAQLCFKNNNIFIYTKCNIALYWHLNKS